MKIGCHLSSSGGYLAMGQTAVSIGANVFQFFTRNPRGGAAKPVDKNDVASFLSYAKEHSISPILAHAPYTLNAASADERIRDFAFSVFTDDLKRLQLTPGALYNFHPGSHVGQGVEKGIDLITELLVKVLGEFKSLISDKTFSTTILFETMAGKGSEIGATFEEIKTLLNMTESRFCETYSIELPKETLGVCLDTCHIWDGGYDIVNNLDSVIDEFDKIIGLERLKAIHTNDSMNVCSAHKDRHEKIGKGKLGLQFFERLINHPKLKDLPFYLETPCDLQGYKEEIELLKGLQK